MNFTSPVKLPGISCYRLTVANVAKQPELLFPSCRKTQKWRLFFRRATNGPKTSKSSRTQATRRRPKRSRLPALGKARVGLGEEPPPPTEPGSD